VSSVRPLTGEQLRAWHALLQGHAELVRCLERELAGETGLTLDAYEVLAHLSQAPGRRMPVGRLCEVVNLSLSGVSRLVDKLARGALVTRSRRADDARVVDVVLTDAGFTALRDAYPIHLRGVREHFVDRLTPEQLATLADAMDAVRRGREDGRDVSACG
jgi:DNA-binding MarR family transcriptional regulator